MHYVIKANTPEECLEEVLAALKIMRGRLVSTAPRDNTQKAQRERAAQFGVYDALIAMFELTRVVPKGWEGNFYDPEQEKHND